MNLREPGWGRTGEEQEGNDDQLSAFSGQGEGPPMSVRIQFGAPGIMETGIPVSAGGVD